MVLIQNEQEEPGEEVYQEIIGQAIENRTSFALWQGFLGRVRAFISEYLPGVGTEPLNQEPVVNEREERPEVNTNATTSSTEDDGMRMIFDHRIAVLYERASELERLTETLREKMDEVKETIEQEEQMMKMRKFQRDLDDDRHLGGV